MLLALGVGMPAKEATMHQASTVTELVEGAQAGRQDAWNLLVDRFLPLVCGVIGRFRLNAADADDINATVWLRLVEHLDDLREPRALPGWLATTARREALRVCATRGRSVPVDPIGMVLDRERVAADFDEALVAEERAQALRDGLQELPAPRRELLLLLLADPPLTYDQISETLGIPKGSIGPTRARALDQLRHSVAMRDHLIAVGYDDQGGGHDVAVG